VIRLPGAHADNLTMPTALLSRAPQVAPCEHDRERRVRADLPPIDDIFDT
jgi:hypothetical protein